MQLTYISSKKQRNKTKNLRNLKIFTSVAKRKTRKVAGSFKLKLKMQLKHTKLSLLQPLTSETLLRLYHMTNL